MAKKKMYLDVFGQGKSKKHGNVVSLHQLNPHHMDHPSHKVQWNIELPKEKPISLIQSFDKKKNKNKNKRKKKKAKKSHNGSIKNHMVLDVFNNKKGIRNKISITGIDFLVFRKKLRQLEMLPTLIISMIIEFLTGYDRLQFRITGRFGHKMIPIQKGFLTCHHIRTNIFDELPGTETQNGLMSYQNFLLDSIKFHRKLSHDLGYMCMGNRSGDHIISIQLKQECNKCKKKIIRLTYMVPLKSFHDVSECYDENYRYCNNMSLQYEQLSEYEIKRLTSDHKTIAYMDICPLEFENIRIKD